MATIAFRGKVREVQYVDGTHAYRYVQVPQLGTRHCDIAQFRTHPKYGMYANSDLLPGSLRKLRERMFPNGYVRLDNVPDGVTVDESGFLAEVTISV